jgi:hypothetical protein
MSSACCDEAGCRGKGAGGATPEPSKDESRTDLPGAACVRQGEVGALLTFSTWWWLV